MATFVEHEGKIRITADSSDDVQVVTVTRQQARDYFDGQSLPEDFETCLDLAQAEADTVEAILILRILKEEA